MASTQAPPRSCCCCEYVRAVRCVECTFARSCWRWRARAPPPLLSLNLMHRSQQSLKIARRRQPRSTTRRPILVPSRCHFFLHDHQPNPRTHVASSAPPIVPTTGWDFARRSELARRATRPSSHHRLSPFSRRPLHPRLSCATAQRTRANESQDQTVRRTMPPLPTTRTHNLRLRDESLDRKGGTAWRPGGGT